MHLASHWDQADPVGTVQPLHVNVPIVRTVWCLMVEMPHLLAVDHDLGRKNIDILLRTKTQPPLLVTAQLWDSQAP